MKNRIYVERITLKQLNQLIALGYAVVFKGVKYGNQSNY